MFAIHNICSASECLNVSQTDYGFFSAYIRISAKRWCTPWTGRRFITGLTFNILKILINTCATAPWWPCLSAVITVAFGIFSQRASSYIPAQPVKLSVGPSYRFKPHAYSAGLSHPACSDGRAILIPQAFCGQILCNWRFEPDPFYDPHLRGFR